MRKRSKAREYALQILYQADIRRASPLQVLTEFWEGHHPPAEIKTFTEQLIRGTAAHLEEIDPLIASRASNWSLKRMGVVDRNVLRLGVFELLFAEEIPPKVSINEAVDLAKRFGDAESGKFINGVLDAIHKSPVVADAAGSPSEAAPSAASDPAPGGGASPSGAGSPA